MKRLRISTRLLVAIVISLLTLLFLATSWYLLGQFNNVTKSDGVEQSINKRQRATNNVVTQLYRAEVIGQSVSAGEESLLPLYRSSMKRTSDAVDSLRAIVKGPKEHERLDSVKALLRLKVENMESLLLAMGADNSDELYRKYIDDLIANHNHLLDMPQVKQSETTRTTETTVNKKRKNFFGRLRDAFAKEEKNPETMTQKVTESQADTIGGQAVNPADTVAKLIKGMRAKVDGTRLAQIAALQEQTDALRANGQELSRKVSELLGVIVDESDHTAEMKRQKAEAARQEATREIMHIGLIAVVLAMIFLIIIWTDITRGIRYRKELEIAKKRAEDLLRVRERLMLTITHDIKAPVGSIIGYADLAEPMSTDEKQRTYLRNMQNSAKHLLALVNSLLDYHRLDADKMDINKEAFNPRQLFDAIADSYRPTAANKGLRLGYKCDPSLDGQFMGDPFRLRQIAENLMSNAMKFTQQGSVTMTVSAKGKGLTVSVTDTGCGISDDERKRIFKEFTRLKSAQGQEGFGLGLAITQKLVALLGGDINIESTPGKGSTFIVTIPLPAAEGENAAAATATKKEKKQHFSRQFRLLFIDDDRLQVKLAETVLTNLGAKVTTCERPQDLFIKIGEGGYDAVLTDIQMPAMNGFDLLRNIRSLGCADAPTIPVIAMTARSDMDNESVRQDGFAGCLHKPSSQMEIVDVIETAVKQAQQRNYNFSALTAFSADDAEAAAEIMSTFVDETNRNIGRMEKAIAANDLGEMAETAHKMLPLFTMIGADRALNPLSTLNNKRGGTKADTIDIDMARIIVAEARRVVDAATA